MVRRYARTYRRSAAWDARADAKRAAAEAVGLPMREDNDLRGDVPLDLRGVFWRNLVWKRVHGQLAGKIVDLDTGEVLHRASIKEALHWIADRIPRTLAPWSLE